MTTSTNLFSVIIPVFNKWDLTKQCLESLQKETLGLSYEVIVVDNASSDETGAYLDQLGSALFADKFRSIHLPENRNFGPACNLGAELANAPYLLFLNNDTILTPNWAYPLLDILDNDPNVAAVDPILIYPDQTIQHAGIAFTMTGPIHFYRRFPIVHPLLTKERSLQALTAAAFMVRRDLFLKLPGFYEEYKNGFEDVDLCLHLIDLGYKLICTPKSRIMHLESQSPGRHDQSKKNATLLQKRCGHICHVDLHILGMRDGLRPFVDDTLDLNLGLPMEEEKRLLALAQDKPISYWHDLVKENPLWVTGRQCLANFFENLGQRKIALLMTSELAFLVKTKENYLKVLAYEAEFGDDEPVLFAEARTIFDSIIQKTKNLDFVKTRLRAAQNINDQFLINLYKNKITSMNKSLSKK